MKCFALLAGAKIVPPRDNSEVHGSLERPAVRSFGGKWTYGLGGSWLSTSALRPIGDLQLKGPSPGFPASMYPYVVLRGPTYRENSHANHTWHQHSHQTAYFMGSKAPPAWVRFPSPAPFSP